MKNRLPPFYGFIVFCIFLFLTPSDSRAQFRMVGSTVQTGCSCYRLTVSTGGENGSIWSQPTIDLNSSFDFTFSVMAGCSDGGADGLVFVLQPAATAVGVSGGGMGYQGIAPSVSVELDTYENGWDPAYDHVAIMRNGVNDHSSPDNLAGPATALASGGNIEDCANHLFRITWNAATTTIQVYVDGSLRLTYSGNIVTSTFGGNPLVHFGFTSSTGGSMNEHSVCMTSSADFSANTYSICEGEQINFTDMSVTDFGTFTSWQWDFDDNSTSSSQNPSHVFSTAGTYNVQLTVNDLGGCAKTQSKVVTVNAIPSLNVVPSATTLCEGENATIAASGAASYTWLPSAGLNTTTGNQVVASPASTTTYTVQGTTGAGCSSTATVQMTVNALPVLTISPSTAICAGDSVQLVISGSEGYTWTPSAGLSSTTNSTVVSTPAVTTQYTATGTNVTGCSSTASVTVTVNTIPVLNITPSLNICSGQSTTLSAPGATDYLWTPSTGLSSTTTSSVTATPSVTTTYTVEGTSGAGCSSSGTVTVTVDSLPVLSISSAASICEGESVSLFVTGAATYAWSPSTGLSSPSDSVVVATPASTTSYTATGTGLNGCTSSANVLLTVRPNPVLVLSPNAVICEGQSTTLNAAGATTYTWSPAGGLSGTTGPAVTAAPSATTTYTVEGILNGCSSLANVSVTVNPLPVLTVTPPTTICLNQSTVLTASGATSLQWSPATSLSTTSGTTVTASPVTTITYTVTGTTLGCVSTATIPVTVAPLLNVFVSPANPVICFGEITQLSAQGAGNYSWSPSSGLSSSSGAIVNASPATTTTYTVVGSSGVCSDTTSFTLTVNPLPVVTLSPPVTICYGESTNLSAAGANSYTWSPANSLNTSSGPNVTATPAGSTVYTVIGSTLGCTDTTTVLVSVTPLPVLNTSPADTICYGFSTGLSVSGASTYLWQPSIGLNDTISANVSASPASTTLYTVTGTVLGCSSTASVLVSVTPLPPVSASPDVTICAGQSTLLSSSGATTYQWSPSSGLDTLQGNSVLAAPAQSTTYIVTGTANGCSDTAAVHVEVIPLPVLTVTPDVVICNGETTLLQASGAVEFQWTPSLTLSSDTGVQVTAQPHSTTTYTVTGITTGCQGQGFVTVSVTPLPVVIASADVAICEGESTTLSVSGADSYVWFPANFLSASTGNTVQASPPDTTLFEVTGTRDGCSSSDAVLVIVHPLPVVHFSPGFSSGCMPLTVAFADSSLAPAGSTYLWQFESQGTSVSASPVITFPDAGQYAVTLTVTTPQQCVASRTENAVEVYSYPVADFSFSPEQTTILDPVIHFSDQSIDGATWSWSFGDAPTFDPVQNPVHIYGDTGSFVVTLITQNVHGCADTLYKIIRIDEDYALYIPNSFTPNDDGINEIFRASGIGIHSYDLIIFDRWGKEVFRSNNQKDGWDGRYDGDGSPCPEGVYVYLLHVKDPDGKRRDYKGRVTLLR